MFLELVVVSVVLKGVFIYSQFVFKNSNSTAVRNEMVQLANLLDTVRILATDKVIVRIRMSPTLTSVCAIMY